MKTSNFVRERERRSRDSRCSRKTEKEKSPFSQFPPVQFFQNKTTSPQASNLGIEQEQTEKTEKEISVRSVRSC